MTGKAEIDTQRIPAHVAVIMDGNGRWAKKRGGLRVFGHQSAITAVRETVEEAAQLGVRYLSLYAFSTENWNRPALEVMALMQLLVHTIRQETATLLKNSIRLEAIGDLSTLPGNCQRELAEAMELTKGGSRMTLVLALSYSGRWDLTQAARRMASARRGGRKHVGALPGDNWHAGPGIAHPHERGAAYQQFYAVATGLYGTIHHGFAVAGFPERAFSGGHSGLPGPGAALW
jgi:undecaprenyl pyrophosphate synthase